MEGEAGRLVRGGRRWRQSFPSRPDSVAAARRFVSGALGQNRWLRFRDDAELLVSELATNAVIHGGGAFEVAVRTSGNGLWVGVTDAGQPGVWLRPQDSELEGGRGLWLVDHLADRWGVEPAGDDQKTVWFWLHSGPGRGRPAADAPGR